MKEYFALQFRMLNRKLIAAGIKPIFAYLILTTGFVGVSIQLFRTTTFAEPIFLFTAIALISKLSETRRANFLKICFDEKQYIIIRILENTICTIPFLALLLIKQRFFSAGMLLAFSTLLALLDFRKTFIFTIKTPFSKKPFEFSTGFRNTFYLIFIAYTLTTIAVFVNNFNLGVFAMLFVFATSMSFYTMPENEFFVWVYHSKPKTFLFDKIKTALQYVTWLILPIFCVLTVWYPENIGILLLFLLMGWAFLTSMIVSKYAAYPDEINILQGIFLALCLWLPPLLLLVIPYLFKKSEIRLSSILK